MTISSICSRACIRPSWPAKLIDLPFFSLAAAPTYVCNGNLIDSLWVKLVFFSLVSLPILPAQIYYYCILYTCTDTHERMDTQSTHVTFSRKFGRQNGRGGRRPVCHKAKSSRNSKVIKEPSLLGSVSAKKKVVSFIFFVWLQERLLN